MWRIHLHRYISHCTGSGTLSPNTAAKIEAVTVGGNVAWGADASYDFRETGWVAGARLDTPRSGRARPHYGAGLEL